MLDHPNSVVLRRLFCHHSCHAHKQNMQYGPNMKNIHRAIHDTTMEPRCEYINKFVEDES